LDPELSHVQHRIRSSPSGKSFALTISDSGKRFLLAEGTDMNYGARHLKRAIERLVVHPLSNLIATDQIKAGDWIEVDFDSVHNSLVFTARTGGLTPQSMSSQLREQSCTCVAAA
jgi:ATP-dependent Clp protease ATP-binding subunit ClpB